MTTTIGKTALYLVILIALGIPAFGQQELRNNNTNENSVPETISALPLAVASPTYNMWLNKRRPKKRGLRYYFSPVPKNWREGVLYASLTADMVSTVATLGHSQCSSIRCRPDAFIEAGWFRFLGNRNTVGIVAGNVGLDVGIVAVSRLVQAKTVGRHGGWRVLRFAANGLLVAKSSQHVYLAVPNYHHTAGWEKWLNNPNSQ